MQRVAVPKTLDAPPRFLWWDCDQVFVFGSGLVIGLAVSGMALAIATAVFLTWVWNRAKGGRGVARALLDAAVAFARENGYKIRPVCPYAEKVLNRDSSFSDVLFK